MERPDVGKDSLLLRAPGVLSGDSKKRPPGQTRLDSQLKKSRLIQDGEVVNPEFLETGYQLPVGFTNPEEQRTAIKLSQVQAQQPSITLSSESCQEMEATVIEEQLWVMPLTGELQQLPLSGLNISASLLTNIGALSQDELIGIAKEQHQLICVIEPKQVELVIEKLHRVQLTGVYLQEFKKKCRYGEFQEQLEACGIGIRSAQDYMTVAKNWELIEAKTHSDALLAEKNIGVTWAIQLIRDEKKQLKSVAPPKDPNSWRTPPNTKEQPVVALV